MLVVLRRSCSISFNLQCLLSLLQCHGCDELETEDMIYYKGKLRPLLSDHPDISEAWKAWDEIIFLSQKETNNDILQDPISSENKRETFLHKSGVDTRAEKDFADTMTAGCKTQRADINDSSKGECDCTSTEETEFDSNSTENVADTVATEHKTQDGDMSILEWLKRRECDEGVIGVFEAIYCQTVAAAPSQMGLLESSREENAWDYGSGNYRLVRLLVDCDRKGSSQVPIDFRGKFRGPGTVGYFENPRKIRSLTESNTEIPKGFRRFLAPNPRTGLQNSNGGEKKIHSRNDKTK